MSMNSRRARRRESSPNRINSARHSSLADRTQRSTNSFRFGNLGGNISGRTPYCVKVSRVDAQNLASRESRVDRARFKVGHVASHLLHPVVRKSSIWHHAASLSYRADDQIHG